MDGIEDIQQLRTIRSEALGPCLRVSFLPYSTVIVAIYSDRMNRSFIRLIDTDDGEVVCEDWNGKGWEMFARGVHRENLLALIR